MPGQVNVIGTLRSKNVVRVVDDQLTDMDGVPVAPTFSVTWAELQAIPKIEANDGITKFCSNAGIHGSHWMYIHAYTDWFALGEVYLGSLQSDVVHGSPLTTHESALSVQLINDGLKSIWKDRDVLRIRGRFLKTGTADGIRNAPYFNTSNAIGGFNARDNTAAGFATPAGTLIEVLEEIEIQRLSATSFRCISLARSIASDNTSSSSSTNNPVTIDTTATSPAINFDTSSAVWLLNEFWAATSTGDTALTCFDAHVVLVPKGI